MNQFKIGVGREIISPNKGAQLQGYPRKRPNIGIRDDLTVNAIACCKGEEKGIMISADLLDSTRELVEAIRAEVSKATGVEKCNISFAVTHTHSGPAVKTEAGWGDADLDYVNKILIPQTVKASKTAYENMQDAVMGVSTIESYVGMNRREFTQDGQVGLGQNPFGIFDKTMTVLAFKGLNGKNIVNIVHYSCHCTSAGATLDVTRDWPGIMIDRLENITGANTVFFNGAEGDVGPRLSNGMTWGTNGYQEMEEIGSVAALDATRAYRQIKEYREVDFKIIKGQLKLPYKPLMTIHEINDRLKQLHALPELHDSLIREENSLNEMLAVYKKGEEISTDLVINQVLFVFNSTIFVPFAFEMFSSIALRLRQFSPYENTLCTCNTNGAESYLPAQEDLIRGGYEVAMFKGGVLKLKDDTDTTIIKENLRIIKENLEK